MLKFLKYCFSLFIFLFFVLLFVDTETTEPSTSGSNLPPTSGSNLIVLNCTDNSVVGHFYSITYEVPVGFVYEDGFKVTEESPITKRPKVVSGLDRRRDPAVVEAEIKRAKELRTDFTLVNNGFWLMINTETVEGYFTYDHQLMKEDGAQRLGTQRTFNFQDKKKGYKNSTHYVFKMGDEVWTWEPAILINREDPSKSLIQSRLGAEGWDPSYDYQTNIPCKFMDIETYNLLHREVSRIVKYTNKLQASKNQF